MMQIKTEKVQSGIPIWQSKNTQVAQGGFTLIDSVFKTEGEIVPAGIPICFDESTRKAVVGKYAIAHATATNSATTYKVKKNHRLAVGLSVSIAGAAAAKAITSITSEDEDYDEIELEATLGKAVGVGDAIFIEETNYSPLEPKGLLYADVEIDSNGVADIAVVIRGTVYERRILPVPEAVKAKLPLIVFSQSY